MAYPMQGITKSIETAIGSKDRRDLVYARLRDGSYYTEGMGITAQEQYRVIERFEMLLRTENA